MAANARTSKIAGKAEQYVFCWRLFTWDYTIGNSETASNSVMAVVIKLRENMAESKFDKGEKVSWLQKIVRVIAHAVILAMLGASIAIITYAVQSTPNTRTQGSEELSSISFTRNQLPSIIATITHVYPMLFDLIGKIENYHAKKALRLHLARVLVLYVLNYTTLIKALFEKLDTFREAISTSEIDSVPIEQEMALRLRRQMGGGINRRYSGEASRARRNKTWEMFENHMEQNVRPSLEYQSTSAKHISNPLESTTEFPFITAKIYVTRIKDITDLPHDLENDTLDYNVTNVSETKDELVTEIEKILKNTPLVSLDQVEAISNATKVNETTTIPSIQIIELLSVDFVVLAFTLHCAGSGHFYKAVTNVLEEKLDPKILKWLRYFGSPGVIIPIMIALMLIIYYLVSLVGGLRKANTDLQKQLVHERTEEKKKIFELAGGGLKRKETSFPNTKISTISGHPYQSESKRQKKKSEANRKLEMHVTDVEEKRREPWRQYIGHDNDSYLMCIPNDEFEEIRDLDNIKTPESERKLNVSNVERIKNIHLANNEYCIEYEKDTTGTSLDVIEMAEFAPSDTFGRSGQRLSIAVPIGKNKLLFKDSITEDDTSSINSADHRMSKINISKTPDDVKSLLKNFQSQENLKVSHGVSLASFPTVLSQVNLNSTDVTVVFQSSPVTGTSIPSRSASVKIGGSVTSLEKSDLTASMMSTNNGNYGSSGVSYETELTPENLIQTSDYNLSKRSGFAYVNARSRSSSIHSLNNNPIISELPPAIPKTLNLKPKKGIKNRIETDVDSSNNIDKTATASKKILTFTRPKFLSSFSVKKNDADLKPIMKAENELASSSSRVSGLAPIIIFEDDSPRRIDTI
uniref:TMC domain-containing protein n=1 Tax=Rhabditophanes sp. KR3021 TaxID=114890 RepID=A0AC35UG60_9BILA